MRIPFDLIAAILCAEHIRDYLDRKGAAPAPAFWAFWVWPAFLFLSWLVHDIAARLTERRTEFGLKPEGTGGLHPQQFHTRLVAAAQVLSVAMFAGALWILKWPVAVAHWPRWFGLSDDYGIGGMAFSRSSVANSVLTLGPYLAAMVLSWIPRRRLACGTRRQMIPLFHYLSFEAKLSWLPLSLCAVLAVLVDVAQMLPHAYTQWFEDDDIQSIFALVLFVVTAAILMPLAAVTLWKCEPFPDGELKNRIVKLLNRSGVKTRAILMWGGRNSGILNACVMGPWSRFRYVLISPMLADELSIDETEAVLAHELGHARYGHLTFYFIVIPCVAIAASPLFDFLASRCKEFPLVQTAVTMAVAIAGVYFIYGAISRQWEREADLASAELIGTPVPLITALEKVAARNGNIRGVPCWHHGSIAERVAAVSKLSGNPGECARFHKRLKNLRIGLIVFAVATLAAEFIFQG